MANWRDDATAVKDEEPATEAQYTTLLKEVEREAITMALARADHFQRPGIEQRRLS